MYFWRRAAHGLYFLRDHDGLGPAVGSLKKARTDGASIYDGEFFHGGVSVYIRERGVPDTAIRRLETEITIRLPDATFTRIGF